MLLIPSVNYKCKNISIKQLVQLALLEYNSSINSVTKHKYDIIIGNTKVLDPFDITEEIITSNYINYRRNKLNELYMTNHNRNLKVKTSTTNNFD